MEYLFLRLEPSECHLSMITVVCISAGHGAFSTNAYKGALILREFCTHSGCSIDGLALPGIDM